jgi:DNA repair exonuclease SbcCD ATPase subunit
MEIRILALRLRNFKGMRQAEYILGGRNARIEGPNGSGKSTVFDAFTWLLFGKDHRDQTSSTFEIKTIDPQTGRPFPREDHWVEALLRVDGQDHVLRRSWTENWVKPTGETEEVLNGHTSGFYVDGVDVGTKAAYDAVVSGWLKEDSFKLLTNPHYFIDDAFTGWKERRKALLELVKDDPNRLRVREEFADVVNKLSGRSIEDYRKRISMEKAANKRDLAQVLSRIDGMREALPKEQDTDAVAVKLAELKARRDKAVAELKAKADALDKSIASADEADAARRAENKAAWDEITKVQLQMNAILDKKRKEATDAYTEQSYKIEMAKRAVSGVRQRLYGISEKHDAKREAQAKAERERGKLAARLNELGEQYKAEKAKAFEFVATDVCPCCGQAIPAATLMRDKKKAQDEFLKMKKEALDGFIGEAKEIKARISELDTFLKGAGEELAALGAELATAEQDLQQKTAEVNALETGAKSVSNTEVEASARSSEEFKALARQEQELRSKALKTASRPADLDELIHDRKQIEQQIRDEMDRFARAELEAQDALSVGKVRAEQEELIRQKEREAKNFADAIAQEEKDEARAAEFVKADIDSVEKAISGLFSVARWKMFDTTMEGGIVETCEVTSPDGVPYRSMNDAMKILCGLDCIRVFSERYGSRAPIFIDNAESITQDTFDTQTQVIRLVVKEIGSLTIIPE